LVVISAPRVFIFVGWGKRNLGGLVFFEMLKRGRMAPAEFLDTRSDRREIVGSARSGHVFSSGRIKRLRSVPATQEEPGGENKAVPIGALSAGLGSLACASTIFGSRECLPAREYLTGTYCRPSETADVPRTTEQPHDQDDDKDNSEYPADAVTTAAAVIAAAIISEAATKKDDQQNNYEYQFHDKASFSQQFCRFRLA
jgi:hypothetical protein